MKQGRFSEEQMLASDGDNVGIANGMLMEQSNSH